MKTKWILLVLLLLGITCVTSRAEPAFIINFTATTSTFGFVQNQTYEWTMSVNGAYNNGASNFGFWNDWTNSQSTGGTLVEGLSGTGISGSYTPGSNYFIVIETDTNGVFYTSAQNFAGGSFGLTPDNTSIAKYFFGVDTALSFPIAGAPFPSVENYFDNYYGLTGSGASTRGRINETDFATVNSVKFVDVIPEPSTWALLGLGLLALFVVRRRSGSVVS